MSAQAKTPDDIVAMLRAGPARIAAATAGLTDDQLATPPAAGEWSANEILAHLRACGDMWGQAIARILDEDHPTFKAINPRGWIKQTDYLTMPFGRSFAAYRQQRDDLLARLESLPATAWSRAATVLVAGRPLARTVHYYAEWLATHERPHVKQIERITN